jgi:hypothetical protein
MTGVSNMTWVNANLALSGSIPAECLPGLALRLGIDRIVDLRAECCDDAVVLRRFGIELLHLPTPDRQVICPEMLRRGAEWVGAALRRRHKVLIHCEHGAGRSVMLVACVLVSQGFDCRDALRVLAERHGSVSLSPEQLVGVLEFAENYRQVAAGRAAPVREDRVRTARG